MSAESFKGLWEEKEDGSLEKVFDLRDLQILDSIERNIEENGFPPSLREIAADYPARNGNDQASSNIKIHIEKLQQLNYVSFLDKDSTGTSLNRTWHLTKRGKLVLRTYAEYLESVTLDPVSEGS